MTLIFIWLHLYGFLYTAYPISPSDVAQAHPGQICLHWSGFFSGSGYRYRDMVDGFVFPSLPEWIHLIDSAYWAVSWFDRWMQIATWFLCGQAKDDLYLLSLRIAEGENLRKDKDQRIQNWGADLHLLTKRIGLIRLNELIKLIELINQLHCSLDLLMTGLFRTPELSPCIVEWTKRKWILPDHQSFPFGQRSKQTDLREVLKQGESTDRFLQFKDEIQW